MSWLSDLRLTNWGTNAAAPTRQEGINFIESGINAVDNPNYLSTVDGKVVQGRTELTVNAPVPALMWYVKAAPATVSDRWITNYGGYSSGLDHCKSNTIAYRATRLTFKCNGPPPAEGIVVALYLNLVLQAPWTMFLPGGTPSGYQLSIAPTGGILIGNGGLVGIRLNQQGSSVQAAWRASFILT